MGYMTDGLTFNALRAGNIARVDQFKNQHGALVHSKNDGSDWTPAQWLQAVVGEIGEYANIRKNFERGDLTLDEFMPAAEEELADVMIYLDILANRLGIDLGQAVIRKFNRTSKEKGIQVTL